MENDRSTIPDSSGSVLSLYVTDHSAETRLNQGITDDLEPDRCEEARVSEFVDAAERCRPQMLRLAARITGNRREADDIVQQALLKAFVNLSKFRGDSRMSTWLCAIVRNIALESIRTRRRHVLVPLDCPLLPNGDGEDLELADVRMNPEECYEQTEREEIVWAAIGKISPIRRRLLEMCVLEERPYLRVATSLNLPLSTIKARLFRSRRELKKVISQSHGIIVQSISK